MLNGLIEYLTLLVIYFASDISIKSDHLNDPRGIKTVLTTATETSLEKMSSLETHEAELALLDLYSGCGGMSTGLCLGAKVAGVNLVPVFLNLHFSYVCLVLPSVSDVFKNLTSLCPFYRDGPLMLTRMHVKA